MSSTRSTPAALALCLAMASVGPRLARAAPAPAARTAPAPAAKAAPAEPATAREAKAAFDAGAEAYALGNYEQAVAKFERSYGLSHEPALLFNLGQAYAKWYDVSQDPAHLRKAKKLFENYVVFLRSQDELDTKAEAEANREIAAIDGKLERIEREDRARAGSGDRAPRRKKVAIGVGVTVGVLAVAGAVVLGVLLGRRGGGAAQPELGTVRTGGWPLLRF